METSITTQTSIITQSSIIMERSITEKVHCQSINQSSIMTAHIVLYKRSIIIIKFRNRTAKISADITILLFKAIY